ncbi:hypothetical protein ABW19_dt0203441 [Dactylella cylindrospora]|nr:hypothetical protein ABW19_dt0203441 [Dactylella cylindrospora]
MPLTGQTHQKFSQLGKSHGIEFVGELPEEEWPTNHRNVFESLEKLKGTKYNTYAVNQPGDSVDTDLWKRKTKTLATKLVTEAKDCISRNEATWRLACEPLVFSRLNSEVACRKCRKRLWRSEVEAKLSGGGSAAVDLRRRQENREACRCPLDARPDDEGERVGLKRLFIGRADDKVIHPADLREKLPQEQRPDRIYGLRQTRNLEDLLYQPLGNGTFLNDTLPQPHYCDSGEPMLFPFLVVEAKAGNAPDDWPSIQLQTAFPIYTYLKTQQTLKAATSQKSRWHSGPLVWFFMSRGDDWRLCLAYQEPAIVPRLSRYSDLDCVTRIVQVWDGHVTNRDDALQLFLIVDYMSDWARDIYRASILGELRILAFPNDEVSSVAPADTEILSTLGIPLNPNIKGPVGVFHSSYDEILSAFKSQDSNLGYVRHIAPIQSRFLSLIITADNARTCLRSVNAKDCSELAGKLVRKLHDESWDRHSLSASQINALEEIWTGHSRTRAAFNAFNTKFYTIHTIAYYFSPSWKQVRDLCIIAVAEEAFDILIKEAGLKPGRGKAVRPHKDKLCGASTERCYEDLKASLSLVRCVSAEQNLLASINRVACQIGHGVSANKAWLRPCDSFVWESVNSLYKAQKKGDIEAGLPFIRISRSKETQIGYPYDDEITAPGDQSSNISRPQRPIPNLFGTLEISDQGAILIYGANGDEITELCVYIVEGPEEPPDKKKLGAIIKGTFEDFDVYHTTRDRGKLNIRAAPEGRSVWNLSRTYGFFFHYWGESFVRWLRLLNEPRPTRQGCPRGDYATGRIVITRDYDPWHDPRRKHIRDGLRASRKKKYIKFLIEQEVKFWANTAQRKGLGDIEYCNICVERVDFQDMAKSSSVCLQQGANLRICAICFMKISDQRNPWLRRAVHKALKAAAVRSPASRLPESGREEDNTTTSPPSFLNSPRALRHQNDDSDDQTSDYASDLEYTDFPYGYYEDYHSEESSGSENDLLLPDPEMTQHLGRNSGPVESLSSPMYTETGESSSTERRRKRTGESSSNEPRRKPVKRKRKRKAIEDLEYLP